MKALLFDSGPLISLTMNNLLWLLKPLKKRFKGEFFIPESVRAELVDDPLKTKKFKFEALQINQYADNKILTVIDDARFKEQTLKILEISNRCFMAKGSSITLVHYAEAAALAAGKMLNAAAVVIDERATRELVEHPTTW